MRAVENTAGEQIVLTRNSEIAIVDDRGREIESYPVPTGATLRVKEGKKVKEELSWRMEPLFHSILQVT